MRQDDKSWRESPWETSLQRPGSVCPTSRDMSQIKAGCCFSLWDFFYGSCSRLVYRESPQSIRPAESNRGGRQMFYSGISMGAQYTLTLAFAHSRLLYTHHTLHTHTHVQTLYTYIYKHIHSTQTQAYMHLHTPCTVHTNLTNSDLCPASIVIYLFGNWTNSFVMNNIIYLRIVKAIASALNSCWNTQVLRPNSPSNILIIPPGTWNTVHDRNSAFTLRHITKSAPLWSGN